MLQVKTRKWVKKKNGLFGWITSVGGPGKYEVPPILGQGGEKLNRNKGIVEASRRWAADGVFGANLD